MKIITLEESQLIFNDIDDLKIFLSDKFEINSDEINMLLFSSLDSFKDKMLIDIIYDSYVYLGSIESKSEMENKLYNKLLDILNYYIRTINFRDKKSRFINEFEYALLHYDEPSLGKKY